MSSKQHSKLLKVAQGGAIPGLAAKLYDFGEFRLDVQNRALRRGQEPVPLTPKAFEVLLMLVRNSGEVSKDELMQAVWPDSVVEEANLSQTVFVLRKALGETSEQRYILTVPGKGYRFIAPVVEAAAANSVPPPPATLLTENLIGKKVSHYRVLQLLGGGGMGVVYKAEDLKLGRQVAMKFLPGELASDPLAFERLQLEARAASSLDHPNICSIYELGEHEGQPFIVMQLLEGQTLREWIESAAQKSTDSRLDKLLDLAIQIADGLEAAHQKGIIHRDIKPANIFITSRGEAKILDFGVAKFVDIVSEFPQGAAADDGAGGSAQEIRITVFPDLNPTRTGLSIGTPSYLSPEQVRREKLDARSDLFSFGLVLYEMATGQQAFSGNTVAVIREAVLHHSPIAVRELNPTLPLELQRIITKASEKDRERRYQHALEIRRDLARLQAGAASGLGSTTGISSEAAGGEVATPLIWHRTRVAVLVLGSLIVLMAGFGVYFITHGGSVPFQNFTITQITDTGKAEAAAISPDGKYISYMQNDNGAQSLWLRNLATGSDGQIIAPAPRRYQELAFSPDGDYLYFLQSIAPAVRDLYRLPVLGGTPLLIAHDVDSNVTFSPDARRIAYIRGNDPELGKYRLLSASPDGSEEITLDLENIHSVGNNDFPRLAAWSGDGRKIAYHSGRFAAQTGTIEAFDLGSKREGLLARLPKTVLFEMAWLSRKRLLVLYSERGQNSGRSQVGVVSIDAGMLQPVTRDTNSYSGLTLSADKKTAATVQVRTTSTLELVPPLDRNERTATEPHAQVEHVSAFGWTTDGNLIVSDGSRIMGMGADGTKKMTLVNGSASVLGLATCPNGYVLVNWVSHSGGEGNTIWRINSDGSNPRQLTHGVYNTSPACSPDGKWVYYMEGILTLMRVPVEGGQEEVVPRSRVPNLLENQGVADFSPDGKHLLLAVITFLASSEGAKTKLAIIDLDANSGSAPHLVDPDPRSTTSNFSGGARFTPDAKAVAYAIVNKGVWNLWMQPLDGSPGRQITNFTSDRITDFRWSPDGTILALTREHDTSDVVVLRETGQ